LRVQIGSQDPSTAPVVAIELLLKGRAGARNQHYLEFWTAASFAIQFAHGIEGQRFARAELDSRCALAV